jgi:hypothetical protein
MEAGLARLTPAQRVQRAAALTVLSHSMALAEIRRRYPHEDERQHRLRLAARYIEPRLMRAAYAWPND